MLQSDLLEKQAAHVSAEDELSLLRDSNEVLSGALHEAERSCANVRREREQASERARMLEEAVREREGACCALRERLQLLEERCRTVEARLQELDRPEEQPSSEAAQPDSQDRRRGDCRGNGVHNAKVTPARAMSTWGFTAVHLCVLCGFLLVAVSLIVVLVVSADGQAVFSSTLVPSAPLDFELPPVTAVQASASQWPVARARHASAPAATAAEPPLRQREDFGLPPAAAVQVSASQRQARAQHASAPAVTAAEPPPRQREDSGPPPAAAVQAPASPGPVARAQHASAPAVTAAEPPPRQREDTRDETRSGGARRQEEPLQDLSEKEMQDLTKQVALLQHGTPDQRTNAALVLGILATASPEDQAAIVRAGAVIQLVELLKGDVPEARGQAAVALKALAANNTYNKVAIVRAGAIAPLIRLLKEDTLEVQEVAEGALLTLAETDNEAAAALVDLAAEDADDLAAIARAGALSVLADLLKDELPGVREEALAALRNLAGSGQSEDELAILHMAASAGRAMKA